MLEFRVYKLLMLACTATGVYMGAGVRQALMHAAAVMCIVFVSDWLTSFVIP